MTELQYSVWKSPVGPLTIVVSERGVQGLLFGRHVPPDAADAPRATAACRRQLEEYFAGARRDFDLPLDLRGTEFQLRCWRALVRIPYGETRSYAEQARAVGCPRGFRAVGLANHDNPIAIVVPCHRVINSDGKLGGYGGGLDLKLRLLRLERGQGTLL